MPLQLQVASLDELPEEVRALYKPHGDGFRLDVADVDDGALLRALKGERELRKSATHAAKDAERLAAERAEEAARLAADRDRAVAAERALRGRLLDAAVRDAAAAAGLHAPAINDALRAVRESFELTDDGAVVQRDGGRMTLGEFLQEARDTSPHWFPAVGGSGAPQGIARDGDGLRVTRSRFDAMDPRQQAALLREPGARIVD